MKQQIKFTSFYDIQPKPRVIDKRIPFHKTNLLKSRSDLVKAVA